MLALIKRLYRRVFYGKPIGEIDFSPYQPTDDGSEIENYPDYTDDDFEIKYPEYSDEDFK